MFPGTQPGVPWVLSIIVLCLSIQEALFLENGLARTPPMGWLSWERFRCNTDCKNDPENCISEKLFRTMADLLVSEGYAAVGYEYVNVDDCWLEKERSPSGQLVPDRERFPRGMKDLADYVHARNLKFGIYEDYGNYTCAGYPGIIGNLENDALTFASWGVDYVKLDGCYSLPRDMDRGYTEFGYYLNKTSRPMVYSCSWPVYQIYAGITPNFRAITSVCNLWRNFDDIQDSWQSLESIIDYYGNNQDSIIPNAGPGHFNDPDMLIIGNFGLSYEQSKTQMALWAILAAPLLMSVDLRTIRPEYKAILQNKKIIAVDQDPLAIQGRRIYKHRGIEIWARPVTPLYQNYFSYAIAFINRRTDGTPSDIAVTLRELGLVNPGGYHVEDLYEDVSYGVLNPSTKIKVKVNPSGVVILRADVQSPKILRPTAVANSLRFLPLTGTEPVDDNAINYQLPPRVPLPTSDPIEGDFIPGQSTARTPLARDPEYVQGREDVLPIRRTQFVSQYNQQFVPAETTSRYVASNQLQRPRNSQSVVADPFQQYRIQQF